MKKFYVGVKGIVHDKRGYLILLKKSVNHSEKVWEVPGGRIDENETIEETLTRELLEEVPGIIVNEINGLQGAFRLHKDIDEDTSLVLLFYLVDAVAPETITLSEEHSAYKWVKSKEDIPNIGLNKEIKDILNNLLRDTQND